MHCPFCQAESTRVVDSRLVNEGAAVRRRRICQVCNERFTTFETVNLNLPRVIKSNETRESFAPDKLRRGVLHSLEKRPVSTEQVELMIDKIKKRMMLAGEKEISSRQIGDWVMHELRKLDEVAYVRFASVYRSFQDVNAFREMIEKLEDDALLKLQDSQLELIPDKANDV